MKELYRFRQFLAEGVIKEAYNLPDSDSTTDKYVNNHWDGILKDILRAHTDLRNSKGGESIPERPSQLDIDIVLGRFDGADEFMDVDPNVYDEYFDFYDMYLVTQRDEENTKDISVEDYPEGDYSGYTKRDDLPKLDEGVIKENIKFINYVTVDQDELKAQYDKHYDDYGNDEDFIEEYGRDFLSPNIEAINQYYGAKASADDVIEDFFTAGGVSNISSNEEFEAWLDKNREFYI